MDQRTEKEMTATSIVAAAAAWEALTTSLGFAISAKDSESNAHDMMGLLDQLLETAAKLGDKAPAGIQGLIDFATDWVTAYESRHEQIPLSDPVELLKHLMESNGLLQKDLAKEFGGQPVVSAVLRGERKINGRQAVVLGKRFGISAAAFLGNANAESPAVTTAEVADIWMPIPNVPEVYEEFRSVRQVGTQRAYVIKKQLANFFTVESKLATKRLVPNYEGITNQQESITVELLSLAKRQSTTQSKRHTWSRRKPANA